ncbi:hypothetical protein ACWIUD_11985 [Helicobacter sp. 23-1044]
MVASLHSQNKAKPKFLYPILRIVIRALHESNFIFCHFERSEKSQNLKIIRHCETCQRQVVAIHLVSTNHIKFRQIHII